MSDQFLENIICEDIFIKRRFLKDIPATTRSVLALPFFAPFYINCVHSIVKSVEINECVRTPHELSHSLEASGANDNSIQLVDEQNLFFFIKEQVTLV